MFIDTYFPMVDGVINVVDNYAKRLNGEEFEAVVFCPRTRDKHYRDDFSYRVERCKSLKIFFLDYDLPMPAFDRKFKKALKESKLDLVHIHSPFGVAKAGLRYAKKNNIPAIAFLHSQFEQDFYQATKSKLLTKILLKYVMATFNRCDEYYTVNRKCVDIFSEYGTKHPPLVQPNGTDFLPVEDEANAVRVVNETYGIPEDVPLFLFVGRICKLKNVFFLAEALSKLKDRHFRMIFVGTGQDIEELKKYVSKLGLEDKVIFAGKVTDKEMLKALYFRAELFLFPSTYDTNGIVQIEAASQKTPTLFIKGTAAASATTDRVNGFLSENSTLSYAAKIEEILSDKTLLARVGEGAFRDLYVTWNENVNAMKEEYKRLIAEYKDTHKAPPVVR